jgi:phage shock protein C
MNMKKLYKSDKNRMFCGVCGGIADYLNIDPTVIRVLWVLFACLGGSGILAYIIIAMILPENKNVIN